MKARLQYAKLSPEPYRHYRAVSEYLHACTVDAALVDLVLLRVSQMNGCAYCCDMHSRDARERGESERRLHNLAAWRESPLFDARERAALAWAEAVTRIAETHAPDAEFDALKAVFSDEQISDLGFAIAQINAWNRLAIGFRTPVPA